MLRELTIILAASAAATLLATALGADNLGIALSFGQIAFIGAVVAVLVVRRRRPD